MEIKHPKIVVAMFPYGIFTFFENYQTLKDIKETIKKF